MTTKTGFTKVLSKRTRRVYGGMRCHAAVAAGAVAAVVLSGCVMGPDYKRPDAAVPNGWRMDYQGAANTANTAWWEGFQDAQLDAMIQEALKNNYDVRVAAARVEEFRAALQVSKSDEYPQLGYESQVGRDRTSQNRQVPLPGNVAPIYYQHVVAADASYELDLWGRVRRSTEAALADLFSQEESQRAVVLSLVSDVATGYIKLLSLDKQLAISRDTLKNRADALKLSEDKYNGGVISQLELAQIKALYEETAAAIPDLERQVQLQENALSVLLGRNPGDLTRGSSFDTLSAPQVPAGLPSDVLKNRPDVRAAEQLLVSANARIGEAKTEYFPTLSLTSQFGFESAQLTNWLHGSSEFGQFFGATVTGPIFSGGKITADIKRAEAIKDETTAGYLKSVQTAFTDVDNALVSHQKSGEQVAAIDREVAALQDYVRLAQQRYEGGFSSYIEVLTAQRSLYTAQIAEVEARNDNYAALISVYKAMGGGWPINQDPVDNPTTVKVSSVQQREAKP